MQNIAWKVILIVAVLLICALAVYPPSEKIRLGKDLSGGTSMVYEVSMPEGTPDKAAVLMQTIEVLKERVNPTGVLDISMQPLGVDRIEVVMPLPSDDVKALKQAFDDALKSLTGTTQLTEIDLDEALQANRAPAAFGGDASQSAAQITELQDAYNALQEARAALTAARTAAAMDAVTAATQAAQTQPDAATQPETQPGTVTQQQLFTLEDRVVTAQERYETLRSLVLSQTLESSRVVRTLGLPNTRKEKKAADGTSLLDDKGNKQFDPSPREVSLTALKDQFPQAAVKIDAVVSAYDTYQSKRTTLDDPEDLMRLLRGAGVLEFRIVVRNSSPEGVNVQTLRQQLAEGGLNHVDSTRAKWFPLNSIEEWAEEPAQQAALEADPEAFFASSRDMVAARHNGQIYLLLYNFPAKAMTHEGSTPWTVESTGRTMDDLGRPAVSFRLDPAGGSLMGKLTGAHVGQQMAIVLDGQVYTAPNLESQIGNSGIIRGRFSDAQISYLIRVLAAGSLSARLSEQPIAISTLGPSLGKDNLVHGLEACLLSIIVTIIIMLVYYFFAGAIANVALLCNALIIFGTMAIMQATFTLPGLAGIALSIAMAVDANVLIYERIREELVNNKEDLRTAIRLGYARALNAIIDGNLTNLIVCVVLLYTATTEVKGFAYTMTIGVLATLFSALFITRVLYTLYTDVFKIRSLHMLPTVYPNIVKFLTPSVDWIARRNVFLAAAAVLCVISLSLVMTRGGAMLDTEFRGGLSITMQTRKAIGSEPKDSADHMLLRRPDVEARIHKIGDDAGPANAAVYELRNASVLTVGDLYADFSASRFQVKVANPPGTAGEATITQAVQDAIVDAFRTELDVEPSLTFNGSNEADAGSFNHSPHTFPIENRTLGANIGRAQYQQPVEAYLGGVAIVIDNIVPPITTDAVVRRIDRIRNQPDFAEQKGREVRAIGLEAIDAANPGAGFTSIAILVRDPNADVRKIDLEQWDAQLAAPEWKVAVMALARGSSLQEVSSFSPSVARTMAANATVAVILSILGMLVYIWIRFGSLRYSLCTVLALSVNVIACLGALALTHHVAGGGIARALMLEEYRVDLNVIAALLTIIGYSLNDTIVILDRIRENRGKRLHASREIINNSINQTFSRTILTGGSTILASIILFTLGGPGIQPFAFTFLIGLIVGTISSVTIAAPLVYKMGAAETETPPPAVGSLALPA